MEEEEKDKLIEGLNDYIRSRRDLLCTIGVCFYNVDKDGELMEPKIHIQRIERYLKGVTTEQLEEELKNRQ